MTTQTQYTLEATRSTLVHVYNTYLLDLVRLCKPHNPNLSAILKNAGHKTIVTASDAYITHAIKSLNEQDRRKELAHTTAAVDTTWDSQASNGFEPLQGVPFNSMLRVTSDGMQKQHNQTVATYLFTLSALAITYEEDSNDLAQTVINVLSRAQLASSTSDQLLQMIDGILEDDIVSILEKVAASSSAAATSASTSASASASASASDGGIEDILSQFKNSKIAQVAAEISEDIDVSSFDPSQLDMSKLGDPNSALGSIVSKVGTKIQSKLSSGEVNHADLISEACGFLKAFQPMMENNVSPDAMKMLSDLMGSMGSMGNMQGQGQQGMNPHGNGQDALQARRNRLQSKLNKKMI